MKWAFVICMCCFALMQEAAAQMSQLSVYKKNGQIALRVVPGEILHIRTSNGWQSDELVMLLQDSIVLGDSRIALHEIQKVRRIRYGLAAASANLMVAGTIWPGIVAINGLSANIRPLVTNRSLVSSGLMLGGGVLLWVWSRPTYNTKEPGRLRIVHFNFERQKQQPTHEPAPTATE